MKSSRRLPSGRRRYVLDQERVVPGSEGRMVAARRSPHAVAGEHRDRRGVSIHGRTTGAICWSPDVTVQLPAALHRGQPIPYEVSLDGQRILAITEPERASAPPLTLVQNWTSLLKK